MYQSTQLVSLAPKISRKIRKKNETIRGKVRLMYLRLLTIAKQHGLFTLNISIYLV